VPRLTAWCARELIDTYRSSFADGRDRFGGGEGVRSLPLEEGPRSATKGGDVTERMIEANGVELCTEPFGDPADPAILLVMGIGGSMLWWEEGFCRW
jgi:hypothetical protein